jgi:hypothetical protein
MEGGAPVLKGFVFLASPEFLLRFVRANAFAGLEEKHDLTYVILQSAEMMAEPRTFSVAEALPRVAWLRFYPERFRRWEELFNVSCIRFRDRSESFDVRIRASMRNTTVRGARLEKLARPDVFERYRSRTQREMGVHPDLLSLTVRERPEFFVLPSALLDYATDDVLQLAETFSIPTLLLVAGWDNLSSKGLLHYHPTCVGVWGEQTKRHAIQVQGLDPRRVHVIGAPHYERLTADGRQDRAAARAKLGVPADRNVVLFAGTLRQFDETQVLQKIDEFIDAKQIPVHVLYRPHPLRVGRESEGQFFDRPWRHVTLDPEIQTARPDTRDSKGVVKENDLLLRLEHLSRVYQAVDAVISPMSTVLLEAMICGLPTMAVAFGDGKHPWSADKVSRMTHFSELYETPDVMVCRDRQQFPASFQELTRRIGDGELSARLRERTNELVFRDSRSYAARVADVADRMLADVANRPQYDAVAVRPGRRYRVRAHMRRAWERMASRHDSRVQAPVRAVWTWAKPKLKTIVMAILRMRDQT